MKLDENRANMKLQTKSLSEPAHHFIRNSSKDVNLKQQRTFKVAHLKNRKPKEKAVYIERYASNLNNIFAPSVQ